MVIEVSPRGVEYIRDENPFGRWQEPPLQWHAHAGATHSGDGEHPDRRARGVAGTTGEELRFVDARSGDYVGGGPRPLVRLPVSSKTP